MFPIEIMTESTKEVLISSCQIDSAITPTMLTTTKQHFQSSTVGYFGGHNWLRKQFGVPKIILQEKALAI